MGRALARALTRHTYAFLCVCVGKKVDRTASVVQAITGNPPHTNKIGFRRRYCNSTMAPTLPKHAWTMNIAAIEGSVNDSYRSNSHTQSHLYRFTLTHTHTTTHSHSHTHLLTARRYNPWRAPGYAPVVDACGQAGGKYKQTPVGGDSFFTTTKLATMGDLGSQVLPKGPAMATWMAGRNAPVTWGMRYNHGGGYAYRLCPADQPLTEECFQQIPLDFDRSKQALVWNNGTRFPIPGIFVDKGTWLVALECCNAYNLMTASPSTTLTRPPGPKAAHGPETRSPV